MGISFIPLTLMGEPIDEYEMLGRLNILPIISFSFWQGAPTFDGNKRTIDLLNSPLDNMRELANLVMAC